MKRDKFAAVLDGVDLRFVGAREEYINAEVERVGGLREGQVIAYHNKAGTRFRHLQKIDGRVCLVIPPFSVHDRFSLALKESILLEKMAKLKYNQKALRAITEKTQARITRARARLAKQQKIKKEMVELANAVKTE